MKKNEKNKKKRGILGWIFLILLIVLAFAGLIAMLMSVVCSFVNPERFVWLSFFGLTYWMILFFNLAVLLLLLLMRSRWAWLPVLTLMVAVPGISKSLSIGKQRDNGELRVMSYNVLNFSNQFNSEKSKEEVAADIAEMVKEYSPDVLCLQEYMDITTIKSKNKREVNIKKLGEMLEMPYHHYNTTSNFGCNVIFSKYPLSALKEDIPFAKENVYGTVAMVDAGDKGVFYVLCCHLVSNQLTDQEVTVFSERNNSKEQVEEYGKSIVQKLKTAYVKRSEEVVSMLGDIPNDGRPILLCGDFNDTPMSYTYHLIRKAGFNDSFIKAGRGIGYTYAGKLPLLRIDYVWTNESIKPVSFQRIKYKGSDHYPIMLSFNLSKEEGLNESKEEDGL